MTVTAGSDKNLVSLRRCPFMPDPTSDTTLAHRQTPPGRLSHHSSDLAFQVVFPVGRGHSAVRGHHAAHRHRFRIGIHQDQPARTTGGPRELSLPEPAVRRHRMHTLLPRPLLQVHHHILLLTEGELAQLGPTGYRPPPPPHTPLSWPPRAP